MSGFVVDLKKLKDLMNRHVVDVYDHRHLNHEVPEFADRIPTTENMAISIWERLAAAACKSELPLAALASQCAYTKWLTCLQTTTALPAGCDSMTKPLSDFSRRYHFSASHQAAC